MSKLTADESQRSSAIDSGNGKLELRNDEALIQIKSALTTLHGSLSSELIGSITSWCRDEEDNNRETNGEYKIGWKKLIALLENDKQPLKAFLDACSDLRKYLEDIESGKIVPTPTPPPAVVTAQVGETNQRVQRAIYAGQRKRKSGEEVNAPSRPSRIMKASRPPQDK